MASGQNNGLTNNDLVYVGIPRERFYIPAFVDNRDRVLAALQAAGRQCGYFQAEGHRVDRNRDKIVEQFLNHAQKPEWLLMLDSDMEHPPDCGLRLARWGAKVVGGLYFHRNKQHDPIAFFQSGKQRDQYGRMVHMWEPIRDMVYDWIIQNRLPLRDGAFTIQTDEGALNRVDAVGTGCILIHRSILERMKPPWFEYRDGAQSEDLEFCQRVREELGETVHVDLSTVSGHYKTIATGQAQFRTIHEGRGVSLASYTHRQAAEWLAAYLDSPVETVAQALIDYRPAQLRDLWRKYEPKTPDEVNEFYQREDVGRCYLYDLLHWNASTGFDSLRRLVMRTRRRRVLEFGGGIGTLGIQLALQENIVTLVETNDWLRRFADWRWDWTKKKTVSAYGSLTVEFSLFDAGEGYDLITAIDVFEHLSESTLRETIRDISGLLKVNGRLFCHNNFGQQDIYPMHFDHSAYWRDILTKAGFFPLDDLWAVKVR